MERLKLRLDRLDRPIDWLFVYTREAHPGENWPEHRNFEQKVLHAKAMREQVGMTRTMVVDSLEGETHRRYGAYPNSVFVIDSHTRLVFKSTWTASWIIESCVERLARLDHWLHAKRGDIIPFRYSGEDAVTLDEGAYHMYIDGLRRSGPRALLDLLGTVDINSRSVTSNSFRERTDTPPPLA